MTNPRVRQPFRKRDHPPRTRRANRPAYAAVDLGTNNCRLLVAEPSVKGFRVIDSFSRIVRLGEGVAATGRLSEEAIDRTIDALRICAAKMRRGRRDPRTQRGDGGLPPGRQPRPVRAARPDRDRSGFRNHLPGRGSAPGAQQLHAAVRPQDPRRHGVRYRRRQHRNRLPPRPGGRHSRPLGAARGRQPLRTIRRRPDLGRRLRRHGRGNGGPPG